MFQRISRITEKFAHVPGDTDEQRFSKQLILIVSVCCCLCGLFWGALYYWFLGPGLTMILPWAFVVIVGLAIPVAHLQRNHLVLTYTQLICITWITALIQWSLGSLHDSGIVITWSFLGPIGALLFLDKKKALFWLAQFMLIVCISVIIEPHLSGDARNATENFRLTFYLMNLCAPGSVVFGASYYFVSNLVKQKKRSDELLLNILPHETAEELKTKGRSDARLFNEVTVMFTDFKSFTTVSEKLSPTGLVAKIHYYYSEFDKIMARHNLEKIKTLGDGYMCAGGLPVPNQTNAENAVSAALEICAFVEREKQKCKAQNEPFFEIRVGCHTGPVVAGIVGINKFAYDIWGDTVNIASRMESSGETGRVNISGTTYNLVKHKFGCEYRGKVPAKNKGEIDMYFAIERLPVNGTVTVQLNGSQPKYFTAEYENSDRRL